MVSGAGFGNRAQVRLIYERVESEEPMTLSGRVLTQPA
jgi:hypothetical protein